MRRLRVVMVERSSASRADLRQILEAEQDIVVVQELGEIASLVRVAIDESPDLIMLDAATIIGEGLRVIEQLMADRPVPLLIMAELTPAAGGEPAAQAIGRGALDVQAKPTLADTRGGAMLRTTVRQLAHVRVVRHIPRSRKSQPQPHSGPAGAHVAADDSLRGLGPAPLGGYTVVGFGSSAGGPSALVAILSRLPANFPACLAVVQHLPPGFVEPFAAFLRSHTALRVMVVANRLPAAPGCIVLPAEDCHLLASSREGFMVNQEPAFRGHRPAVDVLLRSLAAHYGASAVGVVLSGMGNDGTEGLKELRKRGGLAIAQSEQTAAVSGMPGSALESGAAEYALPPDEIAATLLRVCHGAG